MGSIRKSKFEFFRNDNGHVAVIFALIAVPLIGLVSASVDYSRAVSEQAKLDNALDAAVIAAVNNNAISLADKAEFAATHFNANYSGDLKISLTPSVEDSAVRLMAEGDLELSFGPLIGLSDYKIVASSGAMIASENTICLLALNETAAQSILFDGGVSYNSPSCAVHSNSISPSAIVSVSSQAPLAKSFCTTGGALGRFEPYVKGECKPIGDPYASTPPPGIPDVCTVPMKDLVVIKPSYEMSREELRAAFRARLASAYSVLEETRSLRAALEHFFRAESVSVFDEDADRDIQVSQNVTGSYVNISPGTFCGGLTIDGIDVDFLPGEYIIKDGPLSFINGAEAMAEDVTFILAGDNAILNIQSKAELKIKAPSKGPRKGLAVMEVIDKSAPGNRAAFQKQSLISGGGSLAVTGTIYLPGQKLEIRGEGTSVNSMAPATSFIADTLHIDGATGATVKIAVDYKTAGIPPILPRAEDGARLTE